MAIRMTADLHITKLPMEILSQLPYMLDNIDDLYALLSTSRIFYQASAGTSAKLAPSRKVERRLILAGTARQVANWAVERPSNRIKLAYALERGSPGMLQLAFEVARFDLSEIRALHEAKKNVINPLNEKLKRDCTLCEEGRFYRMHCLNIRTVLYDFVTYCELFHADIRSRIDKEATSSALGLQTRNLWIENCLRDVDYKGYNREVLRNRRLRDLQNLARCHIIPEQAAQIMLREVSHMSSGRSRSWFFANHMQHQGVTTLRIILDGGFSSVEERDRAIAEFETLTATAEDGEQGANDRGSSQWVALKEDLLPLAGWYLR